MSHMCDQTPTEKRKEMLVMLNGTVRSLFTQKATYCEPYEDGLELFRIWYDRNCKPCHFPAEWQSMCLRQYMHEKPDESEENACRSFLARRMSFEHQLNPEYQSDEQIHDLLLNAGEVPPIEDELCDHTPRISQRLSNMAANRLRSE